MVRELAISQYTDEKAGYNQSGKITDVLGNLRITFVSNMMIDNFKGALDTIRNVLNIISGKANDTDIGGMNNEIYKIEDNILKASEQFFKENKIYWTNPKLRKQIKIHIENLYRKLEKLQDKYGYGMVSADDPRLAILKK